MAEIKEQGRKKRTNERTMKGKIKRWRGVVGGGGGGGLGGGRKPCHGIVC